MRLLEWLGCSAWPPDWWFGIKLWLLWLTAGLLGNTIHVVNGIVMHLYASRRPDFQEYLDWRRKARHIQNEPTVEDLILSARQGPLAWAKAVREVRASWRLFTTWNRNRRWPM